MESRPHPKPDRIDRYVRGRLPSKASEALERHFMACEACFESVRLRLGAELVRALDEGRAAGRRTQRPRSTAGDR